MVPDSGNATGRLMVAGRSKGMARNFSCGNFIVVCGMYFDTYDNGLIPVGTNGDLWSGNPGFCSAWGPGQCSGGNQLGYGSASYSWTIGATSIIKATSSAQLTVQSPQVTGVSPGTGSGYASVEGGGCSAGGSGGCDVQRPNEIFATNDATGTANCPLTSVARTITYTIEDSTGSPMGTAVPIHENVPVTSSSCNSSLVHTGSGCVLNNLYQPGTLNQFNDYIWAGCPSSASVEPCDFQFSNQQWQFCPASQSPTSIGTVGPVNAGNAIISVHGNITSLVGTTFGP